MAQSTLDYQMFAEVIDIVIPDNSNKTEEWKNPGFNLEVLGMHANIYRANIKVVEAAGLDRVDLQIKDQGTNAIFSNPMEIYSFINFCEKTQNFPSFILDGDSVCKFTGTHTKSANTGPTTLEIVLWGRKTLKKPVAPTA